jgi:hypothetical protein
MAAPNDPLVDEIRKRWGEDQGSHGAFVRHYEKGERAYRGVLSATSKAASWRHQYHPPYAFNLIETIVSNMIEMGLRLDVRPAPKVNLPRDEALRLLDQTAMIEDLLTHEHLVDEMDMKQRPLFLTAAIGGRGILKSYWNYTTGSVKRQGVKMETYQAGNGMTVAVPTIQEITEDGVLRDHSTAEVVDPRDFVVHESARSLDPWAPGGAQHVFHRCWYSMEQLRMMEASGFFSDVEKLSDTKDYSASEYQDRETMVFQANRRKGLIEVLEYWKFEKGAVQRAYLGNREVILRKQEANPFWHGTYPFTVCSSAPMPFSTIGMSDIELIAELQEMLWELGNHRLDNTELIANAIYLIRSDVADPDAFEFYPGARWPVESTDQVQSLQPPYQLIDATIATEGIIKGDLQTVTSATPFAGGADAQSVDNTTATGASIVMNAAQSRLQGKKYQGQQAIRQEAQLRLKNCQQFITDDKLIHITGPGGKDVFRSLDPLEIQGDFVVMLKSINESDLRQERRAEANQALQTMQQVYVNSYISGTPIDLHEVIKWWARQWDLEDEVSAWFEDQQQPDPSIVAYLTGNAPKVQIRGMMDVASTDAAAQAQGLPPSQQQPGAGGIGGGAPVQPAPPDTALYPNMGTTSATAVDASSPSATGGQSMSPILALQRALALSGSLKK